VRMEGAQSESRSMFARCITGIEIPSLTGDSGDDSPKGGYSRSGTVRLRLEAISRTGTVKGGNALIRDGNGEIAAYAHAPQRN